MTTPIAKTYRHAKRQDTLCDARIYFGSDDAAGGGFALAWRHRRCLGQEPPQHRNIAVLEITHQGWGDLTHDCHQPLFKAMALEGAALTPSRFIELLHAHGYVETACAETSAPKL